MNSNNIEEKNNQRKMVTIKKIGLLVLGAIMIAYLVLSFKFILS